MLPHPVTLLGVKIHDISLDDALRQSEAWLREGGFHHIVTLGPEFILEAEDNPKFRQIINRSDAALPDGMGIKVGFLFHGRRFRHRVAGVEYIDGLLRMASRSGHSVFLLGAGPGVAERAAQRMTAQYPGLAIVGIETGRRWPWTPVSHDRIVQRIRQARPDILLVALGAPKQELWIDRARHDLPTVRIAVGVGRTFDYYAGVIPRGPKILRRLGLEWLGTFLFAGRYHAQYGHNTAARRQRVIKATWHFMKRVITA